MCVRYASIGSCYMHLLLYQHPSGGTGAMEAVQGRSVGTESYKARYVVNCAGLYSDKIAQMIGDESFKIKPRVGDYIMLKREEGYLASHTLFPCPGPLGKGVLVQTTLWGNLILGPTARDMHLPEMANQSSEDIQAFIFRKCKELVPFFNAKESFHGFNGARAKSSRGTSYGRCRPHHQ
jgi:glycerol-3-phosphate dehydrogenase